MTAALTEGEDVRSEHGFAIAESGDHQPLKVPVKGTPSSDTPRQGPSMRAPAPSVSAAPDDRSEPVDRTEEPDADRERDSLETFMCAHSDTMLDAIYSEWGPEVWLRVDIYRTARHAKRVAWSGDGVPYGFREDGVLLKDLQVSRVWMRNDGPQQGYDEWWTQVSVTDVADLTEFFRVEPIAPPASATAAEQPPVFGSLRGVRRVVVSSGEHGTRIAVPTPSPLASWDAGVESVRGHLAGRKAVLPRTDPRWTSLPARGSRLGVGNLHYDAPGVSRFQALAW